MNIYKSYTDYELAKKLKEAGFNYYTLFYYDEFNPEHYVGEYPQWGIHNSFSDEVAAPSLDLAAKWIRDKKNIFIDVWNDASGYSYQLYKANNGTTIYTKNYIGPNDGGQWDTYEEALEAGIQDALKRI